MQSTDMQVIKEIPGYKVILKAVLKTQIQQLVEQLADHTGEESVILTASVSDGSLSHLGSESGKVFLEDHDDIKSQFLGFCLKRHHRQKQIEKEKEQEKLRAPTTPTRFGPGPRPRFTPTRIHTSPRQFSPQSQSPRGVHPVSLTRASPQSAGRGGNRHEPYPPGRPRRPNFDSQTRKTPSSMKLPTEPGSVQKININPNEVIKIEAVEEDDTEQSKTSERKSSTDADMAEGSADANASQVPSTDSSSSPSHSAMPSTPTQSIQSPAIKDDGSESSSSTIINEPTEVKYSDTVPPEGLSLDSDLSNLTGIPTETSKMDTSESKTAGSETGTSEVDPNVNVKIEAITESELDLEITGVEPGQMAQSDNSWMPNVQSRMGYGPSTSAGAQGDMSGDSSQGYTPANMNDDEFVTSFSDDEVSGTEADDDPTEVHNVAKDESLLDVSVIEEATHAKTTATQKAVCHKCGKKLGSMSSLTRHMKTHLPNQIRCSHCNRYFASDEAKQQHMILKHSNSICHICGKTYKRLSDLKTHIQSHNDSTAAKFKCPFDGCNKTFVKQTFYQDHLNSHTGEEPYQCQSCLTNFKSRYDRNSHFKLCVGLQKIKCEVCQQSFTHRASLYNHKAAKHSDNLLRCGCGETYRYASGLARHKERKKHFCFRN